LRWCLLLSRANIVNLPIAKKHKSLLKPTGLLDTRGNSVHEFDLKNKCKS